MEDKPDPCRDALLNALHISGLPEADYNWVDDILSHLYKAGWSVTRNYKTDHEFPCVGRLLDVTGIQIAWIVEFPDSVTVTHSDDSTSIWKCIEDVSFSGQDNTLRIEWK
jgi:hypothetical protein